ncbi:hypothetical protein CAG70_18215 [Photobacterium halotolerans]|uniref:Uncharacterized protein n=1 Tax=Photobacterium halotolerans TaxID=265726 RepID=A0A7X4WC53_9GAMM|nr:hypothetical protein [Photobacterium halotolerans]NAX48925.1 hypothetical protein [Photobacterium halotolerans]
MAAQKLTKARLIQILLLLAVLIAAFVWRTITYTSDNKAEEAPRPCANSVEKCTEKDVK